MNLIKKIDVLSIALIIIVTLMFCLRLITETLACYLLNLILGIYTLSSCWRDYLRNRNKKIILISLIFGIFITTLAIIQLYHYFY